MSEDLGLPNDVDGRLVRHVAGDHRPRPHRHAELEVNLVVRGTATYLLGERRYELTPGTLTWLFPGQDHVLVDDCRDHELCAAQEIDPALLNAGLSYLLGLAWRAFTTATTSSRASTCIRQWRPSRARSVATRPASHMTLTRRSRSGPLA